MEALLWLDGEILLFIQEHIRQPWMDGFWSGITHLGDAGWFWIVMSLILLIPKKTRGAGEAGLLALAVGALITNVILKNAVARIRPYEVVEGLKLLIEKQHDFSFPSGHTCASFAAALAYDWTMPGKWGIGAIVLASLIACSRLYVGVHYPTDVLGGLLAGALAAWLAVLTVRKVTQRRGQNIV